MRMRINTAMLNAYQEALQDYLAELKDYTAKRGVGFITVSTATPIERVLFGELMKAGIMS